MIKISPVGYTLHIIAICFIIHHSSLIIRVYRIISTIVFVLLEYIGVLVLLEYIGVFSISARLPLLSRAFAVP